MNKTRVHRPAAAMIAVCLSLLPALSSHAASETVSLDGEAGSNVGSAVHDHPVFKDIPHEGWDDWQFAPLTAPNILFEKMPGVPFDPILESFGYEGKHPQARIFEFKAGKGRLFVANCPFTGDDPVRVTLLDSILEYVTGPDFAPKAEIELEYLRSLLSKK